MTQTLTARATLPLDRAESWVEPAVSLLGAAPMAPEGFEAYSARGGYAALARCRDGDSLWAGLTGSPAFQALQGRGGAAFPTRRKVEVVREAAATGRATSVVVNGAESEPLSFKDRYLMRLRPHAILDGALLAARLVGAGRVHLYVADGQGMDALREAVQSRAAHDPASASGPAQPDIRLVAAQHSYVAGEESAAVRAIATGVARPTDKPPRPYQAGVDGDASLVLNVETLARMALCAMSGEASDAPAGGGAFLATVSGSGLAAGLYEVPLGTTLGEVRGRLGFAPEMGADVLIGGFFGGLMPFDPDLQLDYAAVRARSNGLGCGAMHFVAEDDCVLKVAADVAVFFSEYTARQCRTCISSSQTISLTLSRLGRPAQGVDTLLDDIARWGHQLPGRGACAVPDGLALLLRSLTEHYSAELESHRAVGCARCASAGWDRRWQGLSVDGEELTGRFHWTTGEPPEGGDPR